VSSESVSRGGSNRSLMIILAVVAVIALILGILWISGSAPSFLDSGSHVKNGGNHIYRGIAALVVAIACGAGAWWTGKKA
jgi:phosphotransferase system  glucose/maltose/N-acetylglucosamine-specific IIC component